MDDVISGAVQKKEMSRPSDSGFSFPSQNGVTEIDVNAYPDSTGSSTSQRSASECSVVKDQSTDLFGMSSNQYVCVCGLDIVDMSRCQ